MPRTVSPEVAGSLRRLGLRPRDLVLYVNSACNLRCKHCYVGDRLLDAAESYHAPDLVAFAASFPGLRRVTVLGGEPFLHRRINEVLGGLAALDIGELRVTTNLTGFFHFDPAKAEPSDFLVAVSLDGHTPELHDSIRGAGTFARTSANIRRLVDRGWAVEITHTVTRPTVDELPSLLDLCRELGVRLLNLHLVSPMGNALAHPELVVGPDHWVEACARLRGLARDDGDLRVRYPPLFVSESEYRALCASGEYHPHAAGSFYADGDRVVLYPNGEVYISSEAFGTGAALGRVEGGRFVANPGLDNELTRYAADPATNASEFAGGRSGSRAHPRVLSVSYKRIFHA